MKIASYRLPLLLSGLFVLFATLSPATAQDKEQADQKVKKEMVVKVDEDGNVTINGEPAEEGEVVLPDGSRMIIDKEGGRVIVMEEDDDGKRVIRRRMRAPGQDEDDDTVIFMESDDEGEPRIFRHRVRVPEWVDEEGAHFEIDRLRVPRGIFELHGDAADAAEHAMRLRTMAPFISAEDFDFDFDFEHGNPEIMKQEVEARKLSNQILEAEGAERRDLEQQLEDKLNKIFDMKLETRKKQVEKLQKRLEKQQAELRERENSRSDIVQRRKEELLGDDKLDW
jgi:hypothetical protein